MDTAELYRPILSCTEDAIRKLGGPVATGGLVASIEHEWGRKTLFGADGEPLLVVRFELLVEGDVDTKLTARTRAWQELPGAPGEHAADCMCDAHPAPHSHA